MTLLPPSAEDTHPPWGLRLRPVRAPPLGPVRETLYLTSPVTFGYALTDSLEKEGFLYYFKFILKKHRR